VLPLVARHYLLEIHFSSPSINTTTTYYAEAILNGLCWLKNPVTASVSNKCQLKNYFMPGQTTILDASIPNMLYLWSGEKLLKLLQFQQ
jgi:hypothetical protein